MTTPGTELAPPPGRGTWRLTLHHRAFSDLSWQSTLISELMGAYGRQLTLALNAPAQLAFTLNGRSPAAMLVQELQTDVVAWRWDALTQKDVPYFRGVVGASEDQLTEQSHTVNFKCFDYTAMLNRRYLTQPLVYNPADQDDVVRGLLAQATDSARSSSGASFMPGSYLPLVVTPVNEDGTPRTGTTVPRIRTYAAQSAVGAMLNELALVAGGFDYDVLPNPAASGMRDALRVFYPYRGVARTEPWEYGGRIATVSRSTTSDDYGNYVRVLGNNSSSDPTAPQVFSETWNDAANDVGVVPIGLWQDIDSASDVTIQSTLDQQAAGDLNRSGVLVPSYTLGLRPGVYAQGAVDLGDTVPLVIKSGRLNVTPQGGGVRVLGLTFNIGDDGEEDVSLTVGRPLTSLMDMLEATAADVDALVRR